MDSEFPKGMGDQVGKIMEIPGGRGSNVKPSRTENPVGWGGQTRKKPSVGGVWIFSGTTQSYNELTEEFSELLQKREAWHFNIV